jgi:hypothetical protein
MSAAFTPGPWKAGDCDSFIIWAPRFRTVDWLEHEPGPEAVHIGDAACPGWAPRPEVLSKMSLEDLDRLEEWIEECKANARLMAAAPDLAALIEESLYHLRLDDGAKAYHGRAIAMLSHLRGDS